MEYQHNPTDPVHMVLAHLTERLNRQDQDIAELRAALDDADRMTSQEYADQVVAQIKASLPDIQKAAMAGRRGGRR